MAKTKPAAKTVNKSQVIRDYLKKKPNSSPREISEELAKQGIEASAAFVSTVKTGMKKKRGTKRIGRPKRAAKKAARGGRTARDTVSVSTLVQAKKMADQLGGIEKAKDALITLSKLT